MESFYTQAVSALPWIRTRLAYGFGLLVVLSFVFINTKPNTPVIPQIFIFAVVPLLISMVMTGRHMRDLYQFILIFTITLMCLAFLFTGVALAQFDKTALYDSEYTKQIRPVENVLNRRYLDDHLTDIIKVTSYSQYRALILGIASDDSSNELKIGLEDAVNFYQGYIACRAQLGCLGSPQFDSRIRDFWYTFRPIIEERRTGLWDPDFGRWLQDYAETVRPPLYLSGVRRDPVTGTTALIDTKPQLSWKDKIVVILQSCIDGRSPPAA